MLHFRTVTTDRICSTTSNRGQKFSIRHHSLPRLQLLASDTVRFTVFSLPATTEGREALHNGCYIYILHSSTAISNLAHYCCFFFILRSYFILRFWHRALAVVIRTRTWNPGTRPQLKFAFSYFYPFYLLVHQPLQNKTVDKTVLLRFALHLWSLHFPNRRRVFAFAVWYLYLFVIADDRIRNIL